MYNKFIVSFSNYLNEVELQLRFLKILTSVGLTGYWIFFFIATYSQVPWWIIFLSSMTLYSMGLIPLVMSVAGYTGYSSHVLTGLLVCFTVYILVFFITNILKPKLDELSNIISKEI